MNKYFYALFILVVMVIVGFLAGAFLGSGITSCTEKACMCQSEREVPCNSCSSEDLIFALGLINVAKVCSANEIILCEDKEFKGRRFDVTDDCSIQVHWFDFVLEYLE